MIDRPTLVRMPKDEREIAILQAIVSMADSLKAINEEVGAIRRYLSMSGGKIEALAKPK